MTKTDTPPERKLFDEREEKFAKILDNQSNRIGSVDIGEASTLIEAYHTLVSASICRNNALSDPFGLQ